jgi:hypothetical protein
LGIAGLLIITEAMVAERPKKDSGARLCLAAAWAAWIIKPTLNRNDEGLGFLPGLFFVPKPRSYLDKDDAHRFQLDNKYDFVSELLTYSLQEMYDRGSE